MGKLLKTTEPYSELQILHMLVDDLYWEIRSQNRLSNKGVKTLKNLANHIDQIQGLIMHDEYYKKHQEK